MDRIAVTWLAFVVALVVGGALDDPGSFAVAAFSAAVIVFVGFAAAARGRPLPTRPLRKRVELALLSLAIGIALGFANLAANWAIAQTHPALRALLSERVVTLWPVDALVASPITEEIGVRLFLMSGMAWVILRLTNHPAFALAIALVGSSLFFAALHLDRPMPSDSTLANLYRVELLVKYTLAGVPLGWIFWRWGLPYSTLCHAAANGVHLLVQSYVF